MYVTSREDPVEIISAAFSSPRAIMSNGNPGSMHADESVENF